MTFKTSICIEIISRNTGPYEKWNRLFQQTLITFLSSCCCLGIRNASDDNFHIDTFDISKWRMKIKQNIIEIDNKKNCKVDNYSVEEKIGGVSTLTPAWNTIEIEIARKVIGHLSHDNTLCLISLENQGEVYQSYIGVFWLIDNKCKGVSWKKGEAKNIMKSKHDYCKMKKMSTICGVHTANIGSKIIFTEIQGSDMWTKIIVEPSIEQENNFLNFLFENN